MNEDDESAALAYQEQLEQEQWEEWLASDPAYADWSTKYTAESEQEQDEHGCNHGEGDGRIQFHAGF